MIIADFCFKCGAKLDDTSKFCGNCGTLVRKRETEDNVSYKAANPTKCVYCGAELKATVKFCPSCGKQHGTGDLADDARQLFDASDTD